jgi:hypothetical protein
VKMFVNLLSEDAKEIVITWLDARHTPN